MPKKVGQIYVAEILGNKVQILVAGKEQVGWCGQPIRLMAHSNAQPGGRKEIIHGLENA